VVKRVHMEIAIVGVVGSNRVVLVVLWSFLSSLLTGRTHIVKEIVR
jgi:hypothetical protein